MVKALKLDIAEVRNEDIEGGNVVNYGLIRVEVLYCVDNIKYDKLLLALCEGSCVAEL